MKLVSHVLFITLISLGVLENTPLRAGGGGALKGLLRDTSRSQTKYYQRVSRDHPRCSSFTPKRHFLYNRYRDQHHCFEEPYQNHDLVEPGKLLNRENIKRAIPQSDQKSRNELDDESFHTYQMPEYKKIAAEEVFSDTPGKVTGHEHSYQKKPKRSVTGYRKYSTQRHLNPLYEGENTAIAPALYLTGQRLHEALNQGGPVNAVYCPMGVIQTLALLSGISKKPIQDEIVKFSGNPRLIEDMSQLNNLLQGIALPEDSAHLGNRQRFDFSNGVYALISKALSLNKSMISPIEAVGARVVETDFSDATAAAARLNEIVEKETRGKIKTLLTSESFTPDSVFILLHTLYVKASWAFGETEETTLRFCDVKKKKAFVKAFVLDNAHLQCQQNDGVTFVTLPTVGGCHLTLRHAQDRWDVRPIQASELTTIRNSPGQYIEELKAPFVSMQENLNLKTLLRGHLPSILTREFQSALSHDPLRIADYLQKVTFDMTNQGVEASSATAMHGVRESFSVPQKGLKIMVDSPFSFALTKHLEGDDLLLFEGQVVDHGVLSKKF